MRVSTVKTKLLKGELSFSKRNILRTKKKFSMKLIIIRLSKKALETLLTPYKALKNKNGEKPKVLAKAKGKLSN